MSEKTELVIGMYLVATHVKQGIEEGLAEGLHCMLLVLALLLEAAGVVEVGLGLDGRGSSSVAV